jgi:hypothetical protein
MLKVLLLLVLLYNLYPKPIQMNQKVSRSLKQKNGEIWFRASCSAPGVVSSLCHDWDNRIYQIKWLYRCNWVTMRLSAVQTSVEGLPYHKNCFKCVHGGCTISPSNYAALEGRLYCKHHYSQLFKEKGNYSQFNKTPALKPTVSNASAEL